MNYIRHIRKEYLLDELSRFVSSKSGLIKTTFFLDEQNTFLQVPNARSIDSKGFHHGFGLDLDVTTAMIKSLAEALERYALSCGRVNGALLHKKSAEDLLSLCYSCFYPDYDVYEDFVYKNPRFVRMTPKLKTDWLAVRRFSDNKMIWLQAGFMYCFHSPNNILKLPTSNGMSCSFFDSAVEDSILELVERDTFLYMWLSKSPGEEILFDRVHYPPLKELLELLDCKRKQIKVIYKYTDTRIPCIFVIFKGQKRYNEAAFFITGSADFDIERGCYRALLEFTAIYNVFFTTLTLHTNKAKKIREAGSDFIIKSFGDRMDFYIMYENFHKCGFLFNVSGYKNLSELSGKWKGDVGDGKEELLRSLLKGKDIFIADVTPKEMEKSEARVVRSYSPDLLDLEAGENFLYNSFFKKKRIDEIDKMFNKETKFLNSDPHCYP